MKKIAKYVGIISLLALSGGTVLAQTNYAENLNLINTDLPTAVVNVINYILLFLGLIAVIMILWGGFQWLTAGGNEEKVDKAKKILTAAIIGLVIVLFAYAIANFVISVLLNAA